MKKNFVYSTSEFVIDYLTHNGKGQIIIDCNMYFKKQKEIQRKLKNCEITSWVQRKKGDQV